jgi:hypothetical protein
VSNTFENDDLNFEDKLELVDIKKRSNEQDYFDNVRNTRKDRLSSVLADECSPNTQSFIKIPR